MPFREAHEIVGKAVHHCIDKDCVLLDLSLADFKTISPHFEEDVFDAISIEACVEGRKNYSGTAPECVARQCDVSRRLIEEAKKQIEEWSHIAYAVDDL